MESIIKRALEEDLEAISITDHDTIAGLKEARSAADGSGLIIIPGIEFSSSYNDLSIHMLGYFIDNSNQELTEYLRLCAQRRLQRAESMVHKLQVLGYKVSLPQVLDIAQGGILGRPHVAAAVMEVSEYEEMHEVFKDLLIKGKPGYVPKPTFDAPQIIELIHKCGGVSSLAHPKTIGDESIIPKLVDFGLDAIEVVHSSHSLQDMEKYSAIADQYNLVISGGSDCHGERLGREVIGKYTISMEQVERLASCVPEQRKQAILKDRK